MFHSPLQEWAEHDDGQHGEGAAGTNQDYCHPQPFPSGMHASGPAPAELSALPTACLAELACHVVVLCHVSLSLCHTELCSEPQRCVPLLQQREVTIVVAASIWTAKMLRPNSHIGFMQCHISHIMQL